MEIVMAKKAKTGASRSRNVVLEALAELGLALANHGHKWTSKQRKLFDQAIIKADDLGRVRVPKTKGEAARMIRRANAMLRACGVR